MDTQISLWLEEVRARVAALELLTPGTPEHTELVKNITEDVKTLADATETIDDAVVADDVQSMRVAETLRKRVTDTILEATTSPVKKYTVPLKEATFGLVAWVEEELALANHSQPGDDFYTNPGARGEVRNFLLKHAQKVSEVVLEAALTPAAGDTQEPIERALTTLLGDTGLTAEGITAINDALVAWFIPSTKTNGAQDDE